MGKHTKTKKGKHEGPGGEPTKGPHAHKDGETSASGNPKMGKIPVQTPIQTVDGKDVPFNSKPPGKIKRAIKKVIKKVFHNKRDNWEPLDNA